MPTFLVGQFQDEQTGGQWPTMIANFDPSTKLKVQLTNGTHVEGLGPEHLNRLLEFVDFYVGQRMPKVNSLIRFGAPMLFADMFGTPNANLPFDRFPQFPGQTYAQALAAYEAQPKVHVSWENGGAPAPHLPGEPFSNYQGDYASWPLPGTTNTPYYFQPDGQLSPTPPTVPDTEPRAYSSYAYDPASKIVDPTFARPATTFNKGTGDMGKPLPAVRWNPLTEVRPDGKETFIQSGWLRASHRKLDTGSTDVLPHHSHLAADAAPLPTGEFALARVEIYPFAHVIRAGSRLRINVEVPGGNQAFWQVDPIKFGRAVTNDVGHSAGHASRIVLPVVPSGLLPDVPDALPACPALRGQACRTYLPARTATALTAVAKGADLAVSWTPPAGASPDSYEIRVAPTGQTFTVAGAAPTFTYPSPPPDQRFSFTVAARYGGTTGPRSTASLGVSLSGPATTTTKTAQPTGAKTIGGQVTDLGSGAGLPNIVVTLMKANPSWIVADTTSTDADGNYAFADLAPGTYTARFFDPSGVHERRWWNSKPTYKTADPLVLQPSGAVTATTGPLGYFQFNGVPAGNFYIQYTDPSGTYRSQWYNFKLLFWNDNIVTVGSGTTRADALMG